MSYMSDTELEEALAALPKGADGPPAELAFWRKEAHRARRSEKSKDAALAQKGAELMAARNGALSEVEGMLKVTHLIMNETERAMLIERVRALRLAEVLK